MLQAVIATLMRRLFEFQNSIRPIIMFIVDEAIN